MNKSDIQLLLYQYRQDIKIYTNDYVILPKNIIDAILKDHTPPKNE